MISKTNGINYTNLILRILLYFFLSVFVLYYLLPLFVMITTSLKSLEELILIRNEINPDLVDKLAKKQTLPNLRRLEMY